MTQRFLMGLDAGGGGGRCLLVDPESGASHVAFRPWTHRAAPGTGGVGFDLDTDALWARLGEATREALERAGAAPEQVAGVAATSMRFAVVVVDAQGRTVHAGPNRDARAVAQGLTLAAEHGQALQQTTGLFPWPIMPAPRLQWLRDQDGNAWDRARWFASLSDWLAFRLCGEMAAERTQAAASLVYDLHADAWSDAWIERLGLRRELFPELRAPGERLGSVLPEAAEALGLRPGTPVAVGGGDTQCGLLGCGDLAPGSVAIVAGTSAPVQQVCQGVRSDPAGRTWSTTHLVAGRGVVESNAGPAGEAIAWLARTLFPDSPSPAARLLAEASGSRPGAAGALASLGAQVFHARELGVPLANLAFTHLAAAPEDGARAHLLRAVVEGNAYALRANLEQVFEVTGRESEAVHLTGGLSRSGFVAQLLADVCGRPVRRGPTPEGTALGAALCAGVGAGIFPDLDAAASALAAPADAFVPDDGSREVYDAAYAAWQAARDARAEADGVVRGHAMGSALAASDAGEAAAPRVRPRILVTADLDDDSLARLRGLGEVEYAPFRTAMRLLTGSALVDALKDVQVFVTEVDVVDAESLARLPELRAVATCRGDAVNVDVEACTAMGVPVLHAPGRNADAVADLTLAFLLMLARKLQPASAFLREPGGEAGDMGRMGRAFGTLRGRELWRKTIGLVGLGAVGRGVARRLAGFGARILVHDPYLPEAEILRLDAEPADLDTVLAESDFVSLHAPVTDATTGLVDAAALARMKPGACLVNTARAALVDEEALVAAVESGHLGGVALDVFPVEPPASDHPLFAHDRVIGTPHVGGNTEDVAAHQGRIIGDDLERLVAGLRPRQLLNPAAFEGFDWSTPRPEIDAAALAELASRPGPAVTDLQKGKPRTAARPTPAPDAATPEAPEPPPAVVERMRRLVEAFVERIVGSGALEPHARDRDVTLHFHIADLGLPFWFRLRDGAVSGAAAAPDGEAEVQLRLSADVFDGMFTGRVNPMQAAMDGRLSFSGDTAKAMSLQEFQGDLSRLYQAAREEVGDPGDLTGFAAPGAAAAGPVAEDDPRHELVRVVDELYAQQLITATGGNVSVRAPGRDELWITPSQLFKGDLAPHALVRIGLDGRSLDEGARSPSSERLMHCAVYRTRPDAGAVIHAHAPHATILANTDLPFLPISTEAAFFGNIPRIPFVMPGTQELADAVAAGVEESWAVLMKNHGLLVGGRSLRRAADMVEIIERSAEVILGCHAVGREPPVLPEDVVATLRKMGDLVA